MGDGLGCKPIRAERTPCQRRGIFGHALHNRVVLGCPATKHCPPRAWHCNAYKSTRGATDPQRGHEPASTPCAAKAIPPMHGPTPGTRHQLGQHGDNKTRTHVPALQGEAFQGRTRHGYHRLVLLLVSRLHLRCKHLPNFPLQIPTNRIGSTGIASCAHSLAYAQHTLGAMCARRMAMRNSPAARFLPALVRTCIWGTQCQPRLLLRAGRCLPAKATRA